MSCGADEHCCWIDGKLCMFLEENTVEGRRFACGLLRRYGSWEAVYASEEYQRHMHGFWDRFRPGFGCGDWPFPGETCATCGQVGD